MSQFTFAEDLFLDRKEGILTFTKAPQYVLVCKAGVVLTFKDLMTFLGQYMQVDQRAPEKHFAPGVTTALQDLGVLAKPHAEEEPPVPTKPTVQEKPPPQEKPRVPQPAVIATPSAVPAEPPRKPAEKVNDALAAIKRDILGELGRAGVDAIARGQFDDTIRGMVTNIGKELTPRQILPQISKAEHDKKDRNDRVAQAALATQAFGQRMKLSEEELFLLAKVALIHGLKEQDRENLPVIKRNLLSDKPSPSFSKRLIHTYQEIGQWLARQKVDDEVTDAIKKSQFIYHPHTASDLTREAVVLAVTDAFLALKEGGEKLLIIEEILADRLRQTAPQGPLPVENLPALIEESCYNEYRAACLQGFSGGDHCAFKRLDRNHCSLVIFDVSGHDEEASRIRDAIVAQLPLFKNPEDPSLFTTQINQYLLNGGYPEDRFVSLLYGVIDLKGDFFHYANAGHNPPYLLRNNQILSVKKGDLLLNVAPTEYATHTLPLNREDCLVFYTDGLTEARKNEGANELFGMDRLAATLATHNVSSMKAKRAVSTILKVVSDEGFKIEDDITVQVYRHL